MTPRNALLAAVACVGIASPVHARCGFFGTQLECAVGGGDVSVGTQAADLPRRLTTAFRPQALHGGSHLFDEPPPAGRVRVELQNIGRDPSLCRWIGNEGYCY
jgi:hypothetical protein